MPKQYVPEFKSLVVLTIQQRMPILDASQRYHIAQSMLYRWIRDAELANGSPGSDNTTLQRKSQRLEHILQIIPLSAIIEKVPLQKRLTILARLHEQFEQYSALVPIFRAIAADEIFQIGSAMGCCFSVKWTLAGAGWYADQ